MKAGVDDVRAYQNERDQIDTGANPELRRFPPNKEFVLSA